MPGIQLSGLASGLDTDAVISALTAIERAPRTRITMRQAATGARQRAINDVTTKLRALSDAAQALGSTATWKDAQSITSAEPAKVAARQTSPAAPGGYTIAVTQLATAEQHTYTYTPPAADDTIAIGDRSVAIAAGATAADAARAINSDPTLGLIAIDMAGATDDAPHQLVLVARATGSDGAFAAPGASLVEDTSRARPARDAQYTIDGGPVQTSSSNIVPNAIPGVELTLQGLTSGTGVAVTSPKLDKGSATDALRNFVNTYNSVVDTLRAAVSEKPVANPQTATDAGRGTLYGDTALKAILDSLRQTVGRAFGDGSDPSALSRLSQVGVSTGAATTGTPNPDSIAGKLTIAADTLAARLDADPESVRKLVSGDLGVGAAVQAALRPYVQAGGILDQRSTSAGNDLRQMATELTQFDERIARRQDQLRSQFTAMELALTRTRAQGQDLAARLNSLYQSQ